MPSAQPSTPSKTANGPAAERLALLHAADGLPGKLLAMLRRLPLPGYWHDGGPRLSLLQTDAGIELVETLLRLDEPSRVA